VIIELCGVPGAGKSSIARELVAELRGLGRDASLPLEDVSPRRRRSYRVGRKVGRAAMEVTRHPWTSVGAVRAVVRSGQPTQRDVAVRSLNWLVLRAAMRRARASVGFHVIDQGIIQELCSLGFCGDAQAAIDVADPGVGLLAPDVILVVDVDLELADQRLGSRPGRESRVEADGLDRRRELERHGRLGEEVLASWLERFGDRVPTTVRRVVNGLGDTEVGAMVSSLVLPHGPEAEVATR